MSVRKSHHMITLVYTCDICESQKIITTGSNEIRLPDGWEKEFHNTDYRHICKYCACARKSTNERMLANLVNALHLSGYSDEERTSFFIELQKRCDETTDFFKVK